MTQQQQILTALQGNIESAIDGCKIGIELGSDKHAQQMPVFQSELEKVKAKIKEVELGELMQGEDLLKFVAGVNSQLQQVK